jgi:hypothetical protein
MSATLLKIGDICPPHIKTKCIYNISMCECRKCFPNERSITFSDEFNFKECRVCKHCPSNMLDLKEFTLIRNEVVANEL